MILFIIVSLYILLLSQCTGNGGEKKAPTSNNGVTADGKTLGLNANKDNTTLKVAVSMSPSEFSLLNTQSTQYMQSHVGVTVILENTPQKDFYSKMKKANQLGDAPDLMLLDNNWVHEFAALGFLHPADDYFIGEQQAQGITLLMNQVKWNGYLWGIPKDVDPYILVWNKKVAADNKFTSPPSTAEEMIAWNKAMMNPEEGKQGIYFDPTDAMAFLSLASTLGANSFENNIPLHKLNDPNTIKSLETFFVPQEGGWNVKTLIKNYPLPAPGYDPWDLLAKGKMMAMVTKVSDYKLHKKDELALASLPVKKSLVGVSEVLNGGLLSGRSYTVSAHSKNLLIALKWVKEMTSVDNQVKVWNETKVLPSLTTAFSGTSVQNDDNFKSLVWLIDQGRVIPMDSENHKKITVLQNELLRLWKGEQDMKSFADLGFKLWQLPVKSN